MLDISRGLVVARQRFRVKTVHNDRRTKRSGFGTSAAYLDILDAQMNQGIQAALDIELLDGVMELSGGFRRPGASMTSTDGDIVA